MISRNTIDKVFETARVEEVVGDFIQLKKSGTNFKGLSPFSNERTPSFMVSPVKQIWKDFSSGKGGNAISFIMEHEHFSYPEAIRYLAKKYHIEIEETQQSDEQKQLADERESMYLISEFARDYFHKNLLEDPQGKAIGLSYFKERGFTKDIIKKFQLGYSLNERDAFSNEALNLGYNLKYLEATGLSIVNQSENYGKAQEVFDRFKGRVIFPIHSLGGRVVGFGGRILTNDKKIAKYLNSPESDIYHKSSVLYGIYFAKQAIAKKDNCYLVEGYTDTISFYQAGIENVVASSGTALTENQIRLINRLTKNVTILFDGDEAGIRASLRGIDLILEQGLNVKVVLFPDGEDPDSFSKKVTSEELQLFLDENKQDFISFKVSLLLKETKNDPVKKAGLIREIVVSISKIPDRIQQEIYVQECSRILTISESVLFNELAQLDKKEQRDAHKKPAYELPIEPVLVKTTRHKKIDELTKYEREIIRILLLYGNHSAEFVDLVTTEELEAFDENSFKQIHFTNLVAKEVYLNLQEDEIEFTDEKFKTIYYELIHQLNQNETISVDNLINHSDMEIANLVSDIIMDEEKHKIDNWGRKKIFFKAKEEDLSKMVTDAIYNLRRVLIEQKIASLINDLEGDASAERVQILENVRDYTSLKKRLFESLNRVI